MNSIVKVNFKEQLLIDLIAKFLEREATEERKIKKIAEKRTRISLY